MKLFLCGVLATISINVNAQCWFNPMSMPTKGSTMSDSNSSNLSDTLRNMPAVRSHKELENYFLMVSSSENPFLIMEENARKEFISSLDFNEKGLTSYNYLYLTENLTASQISKILLVFGIRQDLKTLGEIKTLTLKDKNMIKKSSNSTTCIEWGGGGIGGIGGIGGGGGGGGFAPPPPPPPTEPRDYVGYKCFHASCVPTARFICTNNCMREN